MRFWIIAMLLLIAPAAGAFSFATGDCATAGCAAGESFLHTNANEIDTALDTLEAKFTGSDANTALALAANGSNCSAGSYPLGVNASGAVESCTDATTEIDSAIATHAANANAHLSTEVLQDLVGAMFSGNTETGVTVTYQDADGTIDVEVSGGSFDATTIDAVTWSDGANASNAWTFNVSGTDPVVTWGNGTVDFSTPITASSFTADPVANPMTTFIDSDAGDGDVSGQIDVDCTTTTSGSEDCDMMIGVQYNGSAAPVDVLVIDADNHPTLSVRTPSDTTTGSIALGTAGVRMTSDGDGAVTLLGLGNGSDEDLTLNLDDTANTLAISSSTGLNTISAPGISLNLGSGTIQGGVAVSSVGTGGTESAATGQWVFVTAAVTRTLPSVSQAGQSICYYSTGANVVTIEVNGTDVIVLDGTALTGGNTIDSPGTAGDFACLLSNGTNWYVLGKAGTWVDGGAT